MEKVLVIILGVLVLALSIYCLHWLYNIKEWTGKYVANAKSEEPAHKTPFLYNKLIKLLIKDSPAKAPMFLYIIFSSIFILTIAIMIYLISWWYSLS